MTENIDIYSFTPTFCPNKDCDDHHLSDGSKYQYVKNGFVETAKPPHINQKYRCKKCKKGFSQNTFAFHYRKRIVGISSHIMHCTVNGMSNHSIAKTFGISETTVRRSLVHTARQSLLFEKEQNSKIKINESVAYDGFETFTFDQYSPCYINTAVGSKSFYNYSATFSPMNRKGRMTEVQKKKLKQLTDIWGRYPSTAIADKTDYAFKLLKSMSDTDLIVYTDEHKAYLKPAKLNGIIHETTHSSVTRNTYNKLFPINHYHMLYRHFFSSQGRESISFQKNEAALMDKIQCMKIVKNFMKPKFSKGNRFDLDAGVKSPAMYLGLSSRLLEFDDIFHKRRFETHYKLDQEDVRFMERDYGFSRRTIYKY